MYCAGKQDSARTGALNQGRLGDCFLTAAIHWVLCGHAAKIDALVRPLRSTYVRTCSYAWGGVVSSLTQACCTTKRAAYQWTLIPKGFLVLPS